MSWKASGLGSANWIKQTQFQDSRRNDVKRIIKRTWRYLEAALERRLEQAADPRIQIEQAIEEAKRQHALLTQQAAEVVGNERELDIRINRALDTIERLKASIAQAIRMEDRVRREGDVQKAAHYASAAEAIAGRLAGVEASTAELGELRSRAIIASAGYRAERADLAPEAHRAVEAANRARGGAHAGTPERGPRHDGRACAGRRCADARSGARQAGSSIRACDGYGRYCPHLPRYPAARGRDVGDRTARASSTGGDPQECQAGRARRDANDAGLAAVAERGSLGLEDAANHPFAEVTRLLHRFWRTGFRLRP